MEIVAINVKKEKPAKGFKKSVCMVYMNKQEALRTIESLSHQLIERNCNSGRYECIDINGCDFSIAIQDESEHNCVHGYLWAKGCKACEAAMILRVEAKKREKRDARRKIKRS